MDTNKGGRHEAPNNHNPHSAGSRLSTGLLGGVAWGADVRLCQPPRLCSKPPPRYLARDGQSQSMSYYVNDQGWFSPGTAYAGYLDATSCYTTSRTGPIIMAQFCGLESSRQSCGRRSLSLRSWDGNFLIG